MKQFIFLLGIQAALAVSAQDSRLITIKAGEDLAVIYQQLYRYPQFLPGKIYFINDSARSLFNYNKYLGKVEFIGEKRDTLLIADEKSTRYLTIGKDSFYFCNGNYFLSIGDYGFARLYSREILKQMDEKNIGSYGIPSSTHTIENKQTILSLRTVTLQLNKDLVFSKEVEFFFSQGGRYSLAAKKNILKLLNAEEKSLIETFIATNSIDLKKQEDLQNLFNYIASIKKE